MELYENTLAALSNMLKSRQVSSQELTQSVFETIHRQEPEIQAYITLCEEQAMESLVDEAAQEVAALKMGIKNSIPFDYRLKSPTEA